MNILKDIIGAQNGGVLKELAGSFNLNENQAQSALTSLLPALTKGLKNNTTQSGGLESLLGALTRGNHDQYLDQPSRVRDDNARIDGNKILGHILGNKQASRSVAKQASQSTGLSEGLLKQMLPVVANLAMGSLSKQNRSQTQAQSGGGFLSSLLDQDGDGSVGDDLLDLAKKLF